jgi:hydrogenase maturation protein HypF
MAASHLLDAGLDHSVLERSVPAQALDAVRQMIARQFNTQQTSSAGRLFDAVAALAGIRSRVDFEGQAAMELEWAATDVIADGRYPFALVEPAGRSAELPLEIDTRPLIAAAADDVHRGRVAALVARRFHSTLVAIVLEVCTRLREETSLEAVALSGGVFQNALLLGEAAAGLSERGFRVYRHQTVPPNDGGLCLGQLAIAAALENGNNQADAMFAGSPLESAKPL